MRRAGFTLIELLVGATILAGILGTSYLCLEAALRGQRATETRADTLQRARAVLSLLAGDLRSATPLPGDQEFVGMRRNLGEIEADNLDFATHRYRPRRGGESDWCEVSWFVDRSTPRATSGARSYSLWRRTDPTPDADPLSGGRKSEIVPGVRKFRLEYSDGFSWYDEWGDPDRKRRAPRERGENGENGEKGDEEGNGLSSFGNLFGMPEAIRITLALDDPEADRPSSPGAPPVAAKDREVPLLVQTVVRLELAGRIFGGGSASSGGSDTSGNSSEGSEGGAKSPDGQKQP